jgi:hypothetical protein
LLDSKIVLSLLTIFPNRHQLQLQPSVDTVKHETCVLPHSLAELNGGDVCHIKYDDLSVSPAFPLVKCETEVSSLLYTVE